MSSMATHPAAHVTKCDASSLPTTDDYNKPRGAKKVRVGGKTRYYLNSGIPQRFYDRVMSGRSAVAKPKDSERYEDALRATGICPVCLYAYSHMIESQRAECNECYAERIALMGMALERQGVNLGWGTADHTREYERESHQQHRAR